MTGFTPDRRSLLKGGAIDACRCGDHVGRQLLGYRQGLGADLAVEAGSRRQDQPAALEALRRGRRRGLHEDRRRLPEGDRRRTQRLQRIL